MLGSIVSPPTKSLPSCLGERRADRWVLFARSFRILITGDSSGLVETITDSVSVHSIKKAEYGRRMAKGASIVHVSLFDHFVNVSRLRPLLPSLDVSI